VTAAPHLPPDAGSARSGGSRPLLRILLLLAGLFQLAVPIACFGMAATEDGGIGASIMLGIAQLLAIPAVVCTIPGLVLAWRNRLVPAALVFLAGLALQWVLLQIA
jgi:hypothetical protein